ncbi:MAG: cob(I)yrinic acid a,c-diamide adenosyltransferase, partial [Thermodesulfobacteriota bacterium]
MSIRAAGQGLKVLFVQFLKPEDLSSGEKNLIRDRIPEIELIRSNVRHPMFTIGEVSIEGCRKITLTTFEELIKRIEKGNIDLLIMDELNNVLKEGWLDIDHVIDFIKGRPPQLELVITGRNAPLAIIKMADYVTEMLKIKHPAEEGIGARKGIEY